jgi:tRNA nucleotidyltransferase (CCA-adding enzyme)
MGQQLILTHEKTDFDGLASQLAASKLYPEAVPVVPRDPNRNLRNFLTLYWDELPFVRYEDLPRRKQVERIILVDAQTLVTPRGMTGDTLVQIIDHHPLDRALPPHWSYTGGECGATTTLLLERIIETGLSVTPVEATLLALGIYEDTGSLTYSATTVRDLRCVTWLKEHGSNITVVSEFLHQPLTSQQQALYSALQNTAEALSFAGHTVVIATATGRGDIEEISTLAHRFRDLYDPAGLFLLVDQGDHLQVVARSTDDAVDVGRVAKQLGGGGHARAAAALVRGRTLQDTHQELIRLLGEAIQPTITVAQIMSHGVHKLPAHSTVEQAAAVMLRYGFEGFPVIDDAGHIVGILSRREIDRASRLQLADKPISQFMTAGEIQVSPDDSVEHLQQVMISHEVGQVPVVRDGEVIGVVTRTDVIKLWTAPPRAPGRDEIAHRLESALPDPLLNLLRLTSELAQEMGFPLYMVGGFVRDLLLGEPTLDTDLVVEGDAIKLARRVARQVGAGTRCHQRFGTAKIILEGRESEFGVSSVDLAASRMEFYPHSAALPEVEESSIKADLHRRDFTINTLAIRLDSGHYGELLDFYGGAQDLKDKWIRVLHSLSFIEDPTRIMRAARLEQRLGFQIEPRTAELIDTALPMLSRVSGERIRNELYLILREREPERALRRLDSLKVLLQIHPRLFGLESTWERFARLRQVVAGGRWAVPVNQDGQPAPGLYMALITYHLTPPELEALANRLKIYRTDLTLLHQGLELRKHAEELGRPDLSNGELYGLLKQTSSSALLVYWLCNDSELVRQRLWQYEAHLSHVGLVVDGAYLKSLGLRPSPLFRRLLQAVRDARLDGLIETEEEEKTLIARLLAEREGE